MNTIYSDNNGMIRLFDGTVIYVTDYQYSYNGVDTWEDVFQPFTHINPNIPTQTIPGHTYRRVRHAGDTQYQYPEYIVATDGKSVILRNNDGIIEWNYEDLSGTWTEAFNLEDYRGARGEQGEQGMGLSINMYGVGIESTTNGLFDGPATTDPVYTSGYLPGQRPQCINGNPIGSSSCSSCNSNSTSSYTPFVYMDVNTSIVYSCIGGIWYTLTGLVANNNQVAVSTSPTVSRYLDGYDSNTINIASDLLEIVETDSVNLGVQAKHIHKNVADETRGLFKDGLTTGSLYVALDSVGNQSLDFNVGGEIELIDGGVHCIQLNADTVNTLKAINIVSDALEVVADEIMIGYNGTGQLEIVDASLTAAKITDGEVVYSLNGLYDDIIIVEDNTPATGVDVNVVLNGQTIELSTTVDPAVLFPLIPNDTITGVMINSDAVANELGLIVDNANLSGTDKIRVKVDASTIDFNGSGELEFIGDLTTPINSTANVLVKSLEVNGTGDLLRDDVSFDVVAGAGVTVNTTTNSVTDTATLTLTVDMAYINANVTPIVGAVAWGSVTGTLSNQTDLTSYVTTITDLKADRTAGGDVIFSSSADNKRLILTSSGGIKYSVSVDAVGNLQTTLVP